METLDLWITADADVAYRPGYCAPTVVARGECTSRMVSPREFSLWSLTAELAAGVELEWTSTHGDEAVYVKKGSLTIDGRTCPADGALILEAGVPAVVRTDQPTTVVHFAPWDPTPPSTVRMARPPKKGARCTSSARAERTR